METNLQSAKIKQIITTDFGLQQKSKIVKIIECNLIKKTAPNILLEIQKERFIRFYFGDFCEYIKFKSNVTAIKSQWFGDRGWVYVKIIKNFKLDTLIRNYDPEFVYSQNQLVQLKNGLNDGVFHGQDYDIFFYVEQIQILDINQPWCFMDSTDVNSVLKKYNLILPFI